MSLVQRNWSVNLRRSTALAPFRLANAQPAVGSWMGCQGQIAQGRAFSDSSSPQVEDDRIFPVYMHHVSTVVLQHLQDSRADWLVAQGLHQGLQVKSNGTFCLTFPAPKGRDAGKIWTSYDSSTRRHWLSVYRPKFNARFLLKQSRCRSREAKFSAASQNIMQSTHQMSAEDQIRSAVDELIRQMPSSK